MEESGDVVIQVLFRHMHGETEESHGDLSQDSRRPGRDSNRALP
jgi:hypothetical protein